MSNTEKGTVLVSAYPGAVYWSIETCTRRGKILYEQTEDTNYHTAINRAHYIAGKTNAHSIKIHPPYGKNEVLCMPLPCAPQESVHSVWVRNTMTHIDRLINQNPVSADVWNYDNLYEWPFMKSWEEDLSPLQAAVTILEETGYPQDLLPDLLDNTQGD